MIVDPIDSIGGYAFPHNNETFFIGLFNVNKPQWPDIVQPLLLIKKDAVWEVIDERQGIWNDQQTDFEPMVMAGHIVKDFNKTLSEYNEGGAMTWNQELAAIFRLSLILINGQLEIKAE